MVDSNLLPIFTLVQILFHFPTSTAFLITISYHNFHRLHRFSQPVPFHFTLIPILHISKTQQRCSINCHLPHYYTNHCSLSANPLLIISAEQNQARRDRFYRRQQRRSLNNMEDDAAAGPPADPNLAAILASANTNNAQLNATLQALLAHFATPLTPVHDLFSSNLPFNLAHRSGLTAYEQACAPLKTKWDGSADEYPTLLIELRDKARDCKWDAPGDTGITTIPQAGNNFNILYNHHGLTTASIDAAYLARTNDRAVQNARCMYKCLKGSLTGDALTSIFNTPGNAPAHDDGIELLFKCTKLSTVSSVRLANQAVNDLNNYCPSTKNFVIPDIFEDIAKSFIIIASSRSLLDTDKITYALSIIKKIKQPTPFARFTERKEDEYDAGSLLNYNSFSQEVLLQYKKIKTDDPEHKFRGSLSTVHEDIVAMYTKVQAATTKSAPRTTRKMSAP